MGKNILLLITMMIVGAVILFLPSNSFLPSDDTEVAGMFVIFEEDVTEIEARENFEDYGLPIDYKLEYNIDYLWEKRYIVADNDEMLVLRNKLENLENQSVNMEIVEKSNSCVILFGKEVKENTDFMNALEEHNLQLKTGVQCYLRFGDKKKPTVDVDYNTLKRIEDDLEGYNKVLIANFDYSPYTINENEIMAGGLSVWFEEGVTEPEMRQILGDYDLGTEYELNYNTEISYYLMVDKTERLPLMYEFAKVENWTESRYVIAKGDYYIITVSNEVIVDEDFLEILNKHGLQLNQSVQCYVRFDDDIRYDSARKLENELEENERIVFVGIDDVEG
ncbi:UPF0228 family protein [Methanohalophilus profundi]|uniref:UPF0228 family protein n=1 Tax=Methanohalophilus profundi TaxID=2138083 RepID=UPI00101D7CCC|nr:UPF0228 family protein [Methanohalophilus profundi]